MIFDNESISETNGAAVARYSSLSRLKVISFAFLMLGFFVAVFSEKKQALHDMLADTVVVYGRNETPLSEIWPRAVKTVFNKI